MTHFRNGLALCFVATAFSLLTAGPVSATDGVIEINQARANAGGITAGDTPGFPVTLSEAGSYILTGNLDVSDPNTNAIEITATSVHIDLNLFVISGPVSCTGAGASITCTPGGTGVGIVSSAQAAVVTDGSVTSFASGGLSLSSAGRVIRVYAARNGGSGIATGQGSTVTDSTGNLNFGSGISAGDGCLVSGNQARFNFGSGISAGDGSNIRENVARGNAGVGLDAASNLVGYAGNVFGANNGSDANSQVASGTDLGGNLCGWRISCP